MIPQHDRSVDSTKPCSLLTHPTHPKKSFTLNQYLSTVKICCPSGVRVPAQSKDRKPLPFCNVSLTILVFFVYFSNMCVGAKNSCQFFPRKNFNETQYGLRQMCLKLITSKDCPQDFSNHL